jgi:hypothetical protein
MIIKSATFRFSSLWVGLSRFYQNPNRFHLIDQQPFSLNRVFWLLLLGLLATNILDILTIAPVPADLVAQHDFSNYLRDLTPTLGVFWAAVVVKTFVLGLFFMIVGVLYYIRMARSIVLGLLVLGILAGLIGSGLNVANGWPYL